tara:strand:+ start:28 stop:627 length:600 start_codon:yes stop_codon:yes gene_type:complete
MSAYIDIGKSLIQNYVTNKALEKGIAGIEKYTGTSSDDDNDKGTGYTSTQKTGGLGSIIGRALAFSLLGPILGPLAFAGGKGLLNLGQRRGFLPGGEQIVDDSRGTFTADGMQFADVQDTLGSIDSGTDIDYNTGDITDKSTGITTGNVYDEVALTGGDSSSDDGSNGGGGGGSPGSSGPGGSDEMGSFRYGGLASLYR